MAPLHPVAGMVAGWCVDHIRSAASIGQPTAWRRRPVWSIVIAMVVYYALIATVPHLSGHAKPFTYTFNSMLDHLMQGRFDVDPAIIGREGFARDGRVYAYWGIMPAILRLPATIVPHWRDLNLTGTYCLIALVLMAAVKLWTVRFVLRQRPAVPRPLARGMYLVIALSGAQICFLRFSVFQEVCLWAGLCGAMFVAAAIVAQHHGLRERERLVMAAAAGAALLTRVSTGIGLIAAFGLLLTVELVRDRANWRGQLRRSALPLAVLTMAGLITALVNEGRWGNPLTFADYEHYLFNIKYPDRLIRTAEYGLFNVARIPFGLIYYFLPVWVLHGADGQLLFEAMRHRLIDSAELPPGSFFLTDPLLLMVGGIAAIRWCRRRQPADVQAGAIAAGLCLPPLLMLTAISMCFRYRMDFYPLIEFLAFSGLAMVGPASRAGDRRVVNVLTTVSILGSIIVCIGYLAGKFGPGQQFIGEGIGHFYLGRLGLT